MAKIQNFRFIDDLFFSIGLNNYKAGIELILRTVKGDDSIVVDEVFTQEDVINWYGKSVCFDVFASTGNKRFIAEIQRDSRGAVPKRARYNSSLLDSHEMRKGKDYDELPESVVIFICEHDVLKKGLPLYHIQRTVQETGETFDDQSTIIYVNGECQDDTPLGRLMHDFFCTSADDMYNKVLADRMRYFKEDKGGVQTVCEIMEELVKDGEARGVEKEKETRVVRAISMKKLSLPEIADIFEIPLERVTEIGKLHSLL